MTTKELQDFIFERMQFPKESELFNERSDQKVIYKCLYLN